MRTVLATKLQNWIVYCNSSRTHNILWEIINSTFYFAVVLMLTFQHFGKKNHITWKYILVQPFDIQIINFVYLYWKSACKLSINTIKNEVEDAFMKTPNNVDYNQSSFLAVIYPHQTMKFAWDLLIFLHVCDSFRHKNMLVASPPNSIGTSSLSHFPIQIRIHIIFHG